MCLMVNVDICSLYNVDGFLKAFSKESTIKWRPNLWAPNFEFSLGTFCVIQHWAQSTEDCQSLLKAKHILSTVSPNSHPNTNIVYGNCSFSEVHIIPLMFLAMGLITSFFALYVLETTKCLINVWMKVFLEWMTFSLLCFYFSLSKKGKSKQ